MSIHPTFSRITAIVSKRRNVLKRLERISILKKHGKWHSGDRVTGLPKK